MRGTVITALKDANFEVKLENGHTMRAYPCGKIRLNRIRIEIGDQVDIELSPYDLSVGRIVFRHK